MTEELDQLVELVVRATALKPENALADFRIALHHEIDLLKENFKETAGLKNHPAAVAIAATNEFENMIWRGAFKFMEDARRHTPEGFYVPLPAWKVEAEKMGAIFARDFALIAPIEEREFRKMHTAFKKRVRARTNEILASWPVSKKIKNATAIIMIDVAENSIIEALQHLQPESVSSDYWGRQ